MASKMLKIKEEERKKFACQLCPYETEAQKRFKLHVDAVHAKIKDHSCSVCARSFSRDAATSDKTQGHSKIDRTCCLSTSGFVEETGKCLPKKAGMPTQESSTRDPFHYDPAIYPKLRQHWFQCFKGV